MSKITISKILEIFERYDVEYHIAHKLLVVRKPIFVQDFVYLRLLVSLVSKDIEIRVNSNKRSKYYGYY